MGFRELDDRPQLPAVELADRFPVERSSRQGAAYADGWDETRYRPTSAPMEHL